MFSFASSIVSVPVIIETPTLYLSGSWAIALELLGGESGDKKPLLKALPLYTLQDDEKVAKKRKNFLSDSSGFCRTIFICPGYPGPLGQSTFDVSSKLYATDGHLIDYSDIGRVDHWADLLAGNPASVSIQTMVKRYLVYMVQIHTNFRRAELESLADLYGITSVNFDHYDEHSPFFVVELEDDHQASDWIKRSILTRAIYEYWGEGRNLEELHENVQLQPAIEEYKKLYKNDTFKFEFETYRGASKTNRIKQIESFAYLEFKGRINLKSPQQVYTLIEEYKPISDNVSGTVPERLYFGRLVQQSDRVAVEKYDLKKRPYKGTTSFEAELSLVSANIAQVKPGTVMYDPFAGTGSFLCAGGHYGAMVIGSDIDGRMIRGKGASQNIATNFKHYKESTRFLDVVIMDFTHNSLRSNLVIDTILCDPPYGIRESIKVLGAKDPERFVGKENVEIDGEKAFLRRDYIPTKKPYALDSLLDDLLQFAAERLPIGGRLAFWMPTANDENVETIIPLHANLELKYNCVQEFNKWSRRLLVYINRGSAYHGETNWGVSRSTANFRDRYFNNFN